MLATGFAGLVGAVGLLVAVTMTSCELSGSSGGGKARRGSTSSEHKPVVAKDAPTTRGSVRASGEPEMRVRILTAVDSVRLGASTPLIIGQGDPRGATLPALEDHGSAASRATGAITVTLKGGQWTLVDASGVRNFPAANAIIVMPPESAGAAATIAINGTPYPGAVRLSARTDVRETAFDVVEFVGIEDYLCGVVSREMLTGWPLAAYEAQSVAARSYALQERDRSIKLNQPFDVESNDRDQVYGGASASTVVNQAVRSTRGVVLMDGPNVLRAYFSSTCGGRTASAKDTWPTGPGYEFNLAGPIQSSTRAWACDNSPLFRWTVERPRAELVQRLKLFGEKNQLAVRRLRDIAAIESISQTPDGRPSKFKIIEPGGAWYQLSAEELRVASNTGASSPAMPTTAASPAPTPGASTAAVIVPVANPRGSTPATPLPDITRATRVNSSDFVVEVRGEKVTFTGRGFGHGVGLCQYCARGFASKGEDWRTMIARFYPGARIVQAY